MCVSHSPGPAGSRHYLIPAQPVALPATHTRYNIHIYPQQHIRPTGEPTVGDPGRHHTDPGAGGRVAGTGAVNGGAQGTRTPWDLAPEHGQTPYSNAEDPEWRVVGNDPEMILSEAWSHSIFL